MPDVYANIRSAPDEALEFIAKALETRAAIPSQQEMLRDYLSEISFPEGAEVLEVGCGTGAVCRVLAEWPNVAKVVGVEPSPFLLTRRVSYQATKLYSVRRGGWERAPI